MAQIFRHSNNPKKGAMISFDEFKQAGFDKKCDVITAHSDYLTTVKLAGTCLYLYHVGGFFVEVMYSTETKRVVTINAFEDSDRLAVYVEDISLTDLLT